jgi:microcystin-dependent protein
MTQPFLGEIRMFGGNFAPRGNAMCNGQLLAISQNTALFSLLGTFYGGDGKTTFALPDLRGRSPMHQGQGPGLSQRDIGEVAGEENVTLLSTEMPSHTHQVMAVGSAGNNTSPAGNSWASSTTRPYSNQAPNTTMAPQALSIAGGSQPHNNLQPFLVVTFIIALQGIFPARN